MNTHDKKIWSVSELSSCIKEILETSFPYVWVQGEVSNCLCHSSGHTYFSLKDEYAQMRCVLFKGNSLNMKFKIEDGMQLIVQGNISTYLKRGEYQLMVRSVEPIGIGALQYAFEQLKKKLEEEGLFRPERKKTIFFLPKKIGIITSPDGAALHDILKVFRYHNLSIEIIIYGVRVQGEGAGEEIGAALRYMNERYSDIDVLLVGRGGGSLEDLWAFNEEVTARAIVDSRIPIISCVGHEVDVTIADFVADVRASTPSVAAEMIVQKHEDVKIKLSHMQETLIHHMRDIIRVSSEQLTALAKSKALKNPIQRTCEQIQYIDDMKTELSSAMNILINQKEKTALHALDKLTILSPLACLKRGYAIAWKMPSKKILLDTRDLQENDTIRLKLHRGEAEFTIKGVRP